MNRFRQILVSVAGEHAEPAALRRAAGLARRVGAAVKLIDVAEDFPWYARLVLPDVDKLREIVAKQMTERLETLAAPMRREGVDVTVELLHGRPDLETVREVLRGGHDLVLKDADASDGGLFASADMRLLRTCPCPVWLVRPEHGGRLFARILAAVDPMSEEMGAIAGESHGPLNAKILELATSLADWDGGELRVVHAWQAPGEGLLRWRGGASEAAIREYVEGMQTEARKALDRLLVPFVGRIGKGQVHLVRGLAGDAIPEFAEAQGTELIIMGTVARTGIAGLVIGNTAETILQRVQCSVLAVKPDGFVSPVTLGDAESGARPGRHGGTIMRTLKTILLATDFRPASRAAAQAVGRLASVFGSRVSVIHVLEPMPEWPVALHLVREFAEDSLHDTREELLAKGAAVPEASIEVGSAADTIDRKAHVIDADLIVIGAGERSEFDRFSVGPVAEAVLQHASRPVLAVRPGEPVVAFRTILCPVDQSRTSKRGLENAIRLARASGGRLVVLTVVPEATWLTAAVETGKLAGASEEHDRAWRTEFERMLAGIDFGDVPWEREVRTGEVHEAIAAAALDHGADLIVMGSIGRTGLARVLLGSVTRRMLRQLPCSLLVVKDEDLLDELYEDDLRTIRGLMDEGRALLEGQSAEAALAKFREVLARHPYHVAALEGQAEAYERLGHAGEADRSRRRVEAIRNPS